MTEVFIYAIGDDSGTNVIKIGRSGNVTKRLYQLQNASPSVLRVWWQHRTMDLDLERKLHQHFASFRRKGEWFDFQGVDWLPLMEQAAHDLEDPSARASFEVKAPPPAPPPERSWRKHQLHGGDPDWILDDSTGTTVRCVCGHKAAWHGDVPPHTCAREIPGWGAHYLCECIGFRSHVLWDPDAWRAEAATCTEGCE